MQLAIALCRMLPSALCQSVGVLKFGVFSGSSPWPIVPPVNASYQTLRSDPHDSEPVWFATPSPYGSYIHYILPACPVRSASCPSKAVGTARKEHAATHRQLALRHITPDEILQRICLSTSNYGNMDGFALRPRADRRIGPLSESVFPILDVRPATRQ